MRAWVGAVLGLGLATGAAAQTPLRLNGGDATLPAGEWQVTALADGAEARRSLGPGHDLTARIRIEPLTGDPGGDVLARRMGDLQQALMAGKELTYFETVPLTQPGLRCLHAQSIRAEVPPYTVPGAPWGDYAVHRICALPGGSGLVVMLYSERLGPQDPLYPARDTEAQDFFDSFRPAAP